VSMDSSPGIASVAVTPPSSRRLQSWRACQNSCPQYRNAITYAMRSAPADRIVASAERVEEIVPEIVGMFEANADA